MVAILAAMAIVMALTALLMGITMIGVAVRFADSTPERVCFFLSGAGFIVLSGFSAPMAWSLVRIAMT